MKTETAKRLVDEAILETDNAIYLPMELRVSDLGFVTLNGTPIGEQLEVSGSIESWIAASEVASTFIRLFARRVRERADENSAQHKPYTITDASACALFDRPLSWRRRPALSA